MQQEVLMRNQKTNIVIIVFIIIIAAIFGWSKKDSNNTDKLNKETTVVNLTNDSFDEYIGRGIEYHTHMNAEGIKPSEKGWLGNPHPIGWCGICSKYHKRIECIEEFKKDFYNKINDDQGFRKAVYLLKGKRLGCYCKPKECHGDVIKEWIKSQ
jgi:type II secretory pathway pseudopilin PulG